MKTKSGRPWFAFLIDRYVGKTGPNTLYTVGSTVYTSDIQGVIGQDVLTHEFEHSLQQRRAAPILGVWVWWVRYLLSPSYRLAQETAAYRQQYHWAAPSDKNQRARYLTALAGGLAGPLYGHMVDFQTARTMIVQAVAAPGAA